MVVLTRLRRPLLAAVTSLAISIGSGISVTGSLQPVQQDSPISAAAAFVQFIPLNNRKIATKDFLDQAWEQKVRSGLTANSGLVWDSSAREWRLRSKLPDDALKAIAHYASWTAPAGKVGLNTAEAYHELDRLDELAKFYTTFRKIYFTTLGELRKTTAPDITQKLLGPELGPDSAQTLAWYWKQSDGSVVLRDCYQCNADYFYPAARLVRAIAELKPPERTNAMIQFVTEYGPLLASDHLLRLHFADRMRGEMNPGDPAYKKRIMIADEIEDVAAAAELLGAHAYDPKLVAIGDADLAQLKDLIRAGVDRFKFARTLGRDSAGRTCASYFNGDYDLFEDMDYAGNSGEAFPATAQKARLHGASWDISHFSLIPMFMWSLFRNKQATGVAFPEQADIDAIANQYAFHVFQGDYTRPLFENFFDGSDGWYRVNYSSRSNYGVAPSRYCNMFDPSHSCVSIAGIYSWSLLASSDPDLARVQTALIDLARNTDPSIACSQQQCFRERHYHYADMSFSFLDSEGQLQYSPAVIVVLSELVLSFSTGAGKSR